VGLASRLRPSFEQQRQLLRPDREGGFDSGNGIVVRNSQIKMNSVALRARFVHLLEPERRTAIGRVH
jgi:hypothetical protein